MASKIQLLSPQVIAQIAAGEVIERPAAALKELIENSLDAGAHAIEVDIDGGGIERLRIQDDGEGMGEDDLGLCLVRHATSKIRSLADLQEAPQLGFRGEALPSLAAVARLRIRSRQPQQEMGYEIVGESAPMPCAAAVGTVVEVADLFYNTPARLQFLRSPQSEGARCLDVVSRFALIRPDVRWRARRDGREVLFTSGSGQLLDAAYGVWGQDVAEGLVPLDYASDDIAVHGLLGLPSVARPSRTMQVLAINGRLVQCLPLRYALEEAYRGLILKGRYPAVLLLVEIAADGVDVNVHPSKWEVRLREERRVAGAAYAAARQALVPRSGERREPPQATLEQGPALFVAREPEDRPRPEARPLAAEEAAAAFSRPIVVPPAAAAQPERPGGALPAETPRCVGQVGGLYLVCQDNEAVYLIDQHAAHERILYDELRQVAAAVRSQGLLAPILLRLEPQEHVALADYGEALSAMGFQMESFGARDVAVRAVPAALGAQLTAAFVHDVLARLSQGEQAMDRLERLRREVAACRAAVKARDRLAPAEQEALVRRLFASSEPRACPHGRPTFVRLPFAELERRFDRR